jgi:hypothetical protein
MIYRLFFNTNFMNVKAILFSFFILSSFYLFTSCNEEGVDSPILVFLTPEETQIEANSGDRIIITVNSTTSTGNSLDLQIESLDDMYGIVKRLDTSFSSNSINFRFEYTVPAYSDSTSSILIFTLSNDLNQRTEIAKRIFINRGETFLTESSGINIYSTSSNRPNAFSLEALAPGFSTDSATFQADFLDATEMNSDTLSRTWRSNTELSFVEFDGFNYASATSRSIREAYQNGVKLSRISQINGSNILLIGRGNIALGAIQLIAVTDEVGTEEDKYTFSIKVIEERN